MPITRDEPSIISTALGLDDSHDEPAVKRMWCSFVKDRTVLCDEQMRDVEKRRDSACGHS
jgi:hypothetical protein